MKNLDVTYKKLTSSKPQYWSDISSDYWKLFEKSGTPTKKWEEWKYTPLSRIESATFHIESDRKEANTPEENNDSFININLINGVLDHNVQSIPGIQILTLSEAFNKKLLDIKAWKSLSNDENPFYQLNKAFLQEGVVVLIEKQTTLDKPIRVNYNNSSELNSMCQLSVLVVLDFI